MGRLEALTRDLRRFADLDAERRRFALRAVVGAPLVEAALAAAGLRRTLALIDSLPRSPRREPVAAGEGARLVAGVYRHHVVRGACLPRAVLQYALHRLDGAEVALEVGARRIDGVVEAHAWIRGDERAEAYEPLRRMDEGALASADPS
ncbi:MAG TPA: lasso peptide biosynthesis B2 protein [Byssovorax sp.]|jgi:hypothetical protein